MKNSKLRPIEPENRQRIAKEGLENFLRNPPKIPFIFILALALIASVAVFIALWRFVGLILPISAAAAVVVAVIGVPVANKQLQKENKAAAANLEKYLPKVNLQEITTQILQDEAYVTDSSDIITRNWFIAINSGRIVNIADIAAIVGSMADGTFLLTTNGEKIPSMFGENRWGETFELFAKVNPFLLDGNDAVAMPNGKDVRVAKVFNNEPQLVIAEFQRRQAEGEK